MAGRSSLAFHRHPLRTLIQGERAGVLCSRSPRSQPGPIWVVATPELAYEVLRAPPGVYLAGRADRRLLPVLPERTVLTLDSDGHRARRRLLAPLFHGDSLAAIAPVIREVAAGEIARWMRDAPFAVLPRTRFMTLCIAARLLLEVEGQAMVERLEHHLSRALHPYTMLAGVEWLRRLGPISPQAIARRCLAGFADGVAEVRSGRSSTP
jgi:cytochrome P450